VSYAKGTTVRTEKSKADIERLLHRAGASQYVSGWDERHHQSFVQFEMNNRRIRIMVPMPLPDDFTKTETGRYRDHGAINTAMDGEMRRRWRSLLLIIKAKLEAIESKVATFEEEFLPYIVVRGDRTIGELILPQLDEAATTGKLPPLLPGR
jgi:hypothetical protein